MTTSDRSMMPDHTSSPSDLRPNGPSCAGVGFAPLRWIGTGVFLVFAPKCLLCVAGYLGFAAGLGSVGGEICGGTDLPLPGAMLPDAAVLVLSAALLGWRWQVRLRARWSEMKRAAR